MNITRGKSGGRPAFRPKFKLGKIMTQNTERSDSASQHSNHGTFLWKRLLDTVCIVAALPLLLPVLLLIYLMVKLLSEGPALFRQERIGYDGRPFTCLKFRTMKPGADASVHQNHLNHLINSNLPMTKMDKGNDPRLIPCGALLRATGLDELPQLFNVLRGEMSLVGPRPCTPYEFSQYLPWQKERFKTLPGLTGLWQVSGKNRTTFTEMVHLDIYYARNSSLRLDLSIMFKTLPVILLQVNESRNKRRERARDLPKPIIRVSESTSQNEPKPQTNS
jgi:exopolysaccharide production protein ExoY